MSQSWNIDPSTGDYIMVGGAPEQTNSLQVPAYFRLKTKRTRWLYAPDNKFGSDFYLIKKRPSRNSNQRLETIAEVALRPIIDDGRANSVDAVVTENVRGGTGMDVTIVDASGRTEVQTFKGLGV